MLRFDRSKDQIGSGAFAHVFLIRDSGHALKVFITSPASSDMSDGKRRRVFESEIEAYKLAQADPELSKMIPHFYGRRVVESVIETPAERDISANYLQDCCYEMDDAGRGWTKANTAGQYWSRVEECRSIFRSRGIMHLNDCSFRIREDGSIVFIDFGIADVHGDGTL